MRVSYKWLRELVDFPFSPNELAEHLTKLVLEVKEVEPFGRLEIVVVGRVVSVWDHPKSGTIRMRTN